MVFNRTQRRGSLPAVATLALVGLLGAASCGGDAATSTASGCDMTNGQGCLCTAQPMCPGAAVCARYPDTAPTGFCSHACTGQTEGTDCPFMGTNRGSCLWVLDTPGRSLMGCGILCATGRICPARFAPLDVPAPGGQTVCACVPA